LLLLALLAVVLLPATSGTAFESPLTFESPVWTDDGSDGVITAQVEMHEYWLPGLRVGRPTE
jgi:hypothetical protein